MRRHVQSLNYPEGISRSLVPSLSLLAPRLAAIDDQTISDKIHNFIRGWHFVCPNSILPSLILDYFYGDKISLINFLFTLRYISNVVSTTFHNVIYYCSSLSQLNPQLGSLIFWGVWLSLQTQTVTTSNDAFSILLCCIHEVYNFSSLSTNFSKLIREGCNKRFKELCKLWTSTEQAKNATMWASRKHHKTTVQNGPSSA